MKKHQQEEMIQKKEIKSYLSKDAFTRSIRTLGHNSRLKL
jgi:hypothetical protein